MLPSNGRYINERRNYFISFEEFAKLLEFLHQHWDSKWYLFNLIQFMFGLRCSECAAIQLNDFKNDYRLIDYRTAKTNKIILNEPVPESLRIVIKVYIERNSHRLKDGFLFAKHTGKRIDGNPMYSTECIDAMWTKWRRRLAEIHNDVKWLDHYFIHPKRWRLLVEIDKGIVRNEDLIRKTGISKNEILKFIDQLIATGHMMQDGTLTAKGKLYISKPRQIKKYRISSHSLRRLHRTYLSKHIKDDWTLANLCHYQNMRSFLKYKNEFELLEKKEEMLMPIMNPVAERLTNVKTGHQSIKTLEMKEDQQDDKAILLRSDLIQSLREQIKNEIMAELKANQPPPVYEYYDTKARDPAYQADRRRYKETLLKELPEYAKFLMDKAERKETDSTT